MALAKVTIEALAQMAETLRQSADDILATKEQMDSELRSFPWDDPIGLNFISRYEEDFKPLKEKLIPNINNYIQYINQEGNIISEFNNESAGGMGIGGAVGLGAAGIGVSRATKVNANPKKSATVSEHIAFISKDPPAPPPQVFKTDKSSIRAAAAGLLEEMTEKDLSFDSRDMQNRLSDKTDEIFKNKYNSSLNEIAFNLGFNPKKNGCYYDDYNNIAEELRKEVIEMKEKFEPTPIKYMDNDAVYAELSPEQKTTYDKLKKDILERKENAEYRKTIAGINNFFDSDFETPRNVSSRNDSQIYEANKEIKETEGALQKLEKWAKEAVRNNRNQKIAEYISE